MPMSSRCRPLALLLLLGSCSQGPQPGLSSPSAPEATLPHLQPLASTTTVAAYNATSAPTTQGWTASVTKAGSSGGTLVTDQGAGAWKVDGIASRAQWLFTPSAASKQTAATNGWLLTSVVRMESGGYINDYFANGARRFLPILALNASGQLTLTLEGGSTTVLALGAAATAYHTYVQEYDPATGQATLTFDGVRVATWGGAATTQNYVAFGDGSTGTDSVAYYRSVTFEVYTAPSTTRTERDVFRGGGEGAGGTSNYRIPSLAALPSGTLIAAAEGRPSAADPGVAGEPINISVKRSTDDGRTWSPVQVIASDPAYDYSDPRLVVDAVNHALYAFYVRWPDDCGQNTNCNPPGLTDPKVTVLFYRKSTDDGQTWGAPVNVNAQVKDPTWRTLNPGPGQGAQLQRQTAAQGSHNGRLIFPAIVRDGSSVFYNVSISSDDGGLTWKRGSLTPVSGPTEADLTELNDGRLLLSARNDGGASVNRYHFVSSDGGQTWQTLADLGGIKVSRVDASLLNVASGGSSTVVLSAPLGDLTSSGFSGTSRNNLGLWLSGDQGQTFPRFKHLTYGPAAYSALVTLRNGDLGLLYEATGSTLIHFSAVPASTLTAP